MVDGMPQPPGRSLLPYKAPHFVDLSRCDSLNNHLPLVGVELREPRFVDRLKLAFLFFSSLRTVSVLMPNTRAVSRIPLPSKARSIICRFTDGK